MVTKLCGCNTCEAIIERTIAYYGKLLADKECILCAVATARVMGIICETVMEEQVRGILAEQFPGIPKILLELEVSERSERALTGTAQKVRKVWDADLEYHIELLNVHIDRANAAHEEEQKLQKGD